MKKRIVIDADKGETRAAVTEDGQLVELYLERAVKQRLAGSIYKGKVENVLPGMQAAFVNIGLEKNAFLYVSDVLSSQVNGDEDEIVENVNKVSIKDVLQQGQELLVQITKEPIGTKGARVTTHVTLPGRYLVLMPAVDYVGVSRRIEDEKERDRLKNIAKKVRPKKMGLIVRTAAEGMEKDELMRDGKVLKKLWRKIKSKQKKASPPALLHQDLGLMERIIRDTFAKEVNELVVDSKEEYDKILELVDIISPDLKKRVKYFSPRKEAIFEAYDIEPEIDKASKRKVWLKCGGYIIIDRTEALTAIDVNTGKFVGSTSLATTVLKTNLEAAREIAKQIRLRNIGGIIIIDFIDMDKTEDQEKILEALENALINDRTKANILGITQLGLVEMTRKKTSQGLEDAFFRQCPYCEGRGKVLSEETMSKKVEREIRKIIKSTAIEAILVEVHPSVAGVLIGSGGAHLKELEKETRKNIYVKGSTDIGSEDIRISMAGTKKEVEEKALPVKEGQNLDLRIEETHTANSGNGIARLEGYVIDVEGAGGMVGERVPVEITKVYRTYAKAKMLDK